MKKDKFFVILIVLNFAGILIGQGQIPQLINYQGYLTDTEGNPMDGSHTVTFKLYSAETEGTEFWAETRTITVIDGFFNVLLGSIIPIPYSTFESDNVYLTLKIGDDPEMTPRKRLVSVGYAFRAHTADYTVGMDPDRFVETINQIRPDSGNVDLAAGTNITITPDSSNHQIVISSFGSTSDEPCWYLSGNSSTTPGTDFLGTTDENAIELKVNNERALRIEPKEICANIIGGSSLNVVEQDVIGATISGGGGTNSDSRNVITADFGTIGGGGFNRAGNFAVVAGGVLNKASGQESTVGGGQSNDAIGYGATVPGGYDNRALGDYSFAAGYKAKANHIGAFVWSGFSGFDSTCSTEPNQFIINASGGVGIGTNTPNEALSVSGTIESISGGFKFPDGTLQTTSASVDSGWSLNGNGGTTPGDQFLGTTDNQAMEFKVNNTRTLRLEPNEECPNIIGGHHENEAFWNIHGATIGGGGSTDAYTNTISGHFGTISGGRGHQANEYATIGGGDINLASGYCSTVGGGYFNNAGANHTTIGGGNSNSASDFGATVGGGENNIASGRLSCIPGGSKNAARGSTSFAAGYFARANHWGSFVFSDVSSSDSTFSTGENQFIIRAAGGVGIGTNDPHGALDVNGSIFQRGSALHADYVFEPDYTLETIEEHTNFMWSNKHLKAIPPVTRDEGGKEIVEIGSIQKGLVEELEKAHIYIHQLNERIKTLEETLIRMEKSCQENRLIFSSDSD